MIERHGQCKNGKTSNLYTVWVNMIRRVTKPNHQSYKRYGGRGIKVCEEWMDSAIFIKWALENGYKAGLEIDRQNNNGNYEPGNCRFITHKQNMSNIRRNENYAIEKRGRNFRIRIIRDKHTYYGGSVRSLPEALSIRTKLEEQIKNYGNDK